MMQFEYKKFLVVDATSGIGQPLADKFTSNGSYVIVAGCRKENLDAFVEQHKGHASAIQFDITNLDQIKAFSSKVIMSHPDLDCVVVYSGMQRDFNFSNPESVDLAGLELELRTNYLSYVHLVKAFLPFFQSKQRESAFVLVSSGLGIVPILRCPNYCAAKAALHQFALVLREQLKGGPVKVIELFPPIVQTEFHDKEHQSDIKDGRDMAMPLDTFLHQTYLFLGFGDKEVAVGHARDWYNAVEAPRYGEFMQMLKMTTT